MASNDRAGIAVAQPRSDGERLAVADQCGELLQMNMPLLVDELNDYVGLSYSGMPDRLYVIDRDGKVAFQSGRGPFHFEPREMEQGLVMQLLSEAERDPEE